MPPSQPSYNPYSSPIARLETARSYLAEIEAWEPESGWTQADKSDLLDEARAVVVVRQLVVERHARARAA